jgi:hypothetical protein
MFKSFTLTIALVALLASRAPAEQPPVYELSARATRAGDAVTVEFKLSHANPKGQAVDGRPVAKSTRSARIMLNLGKRATMVGSIEVHPLQPGQGPGARADQNGVANLDDLVSGFRVDVISIKGADQILVTASVTEDGAAVWAQSKMIDVSIKPEPTGK